MSITPSVHYLESNNFDLSNNLYFSRDPLFNGKILYHDIFSNFVNGWGYTEGKVINYQYPVSSFTTRSGGDNYCFEIWTVTITDYYYSVNDGPPKYNFTRYSFSSSYHCVNTSSSDNQTVVSWIDDGDGSGGGGGGGYAPPPAELNDKIKKIANTVDMTKEQVTLLNTAVDSFINEGCMQKTLYDALVAKNVKLDFGMVYNPTDSNAPASYNPYYKSIRFKNFVEITSANLKEELFHAWQDVFYSGGTAQYGKDAQGNKLPGYVNIEFEAKVFSDFYSHPDLTCCYAFRPGVDKLPDDLYNQYTIWVYNVRERRIPLQASKYQEWLNLFNQYSPEYSSPAHSNLSIPRAIEILLSNSNCN